VGLGLHVRQDIRQDPVMMQTTAELQPTSRQNSKAVLHLVLQTGLAELGHLLKQPANKILLMIQTTAELQQQAVRATSCTFILYSRLVLRSWGTCVNSLQTRYCYDKITAEARQISPMIISHAYQAQMETCQSI
jgi:uncharacterized protein (DUF486 family)